MIYLNTRIKNAPKHEKVLRGKTSIWVSVIWGTGVALHEKSDKRMISKMSDFGLDKSGKML